MSYFFFQAELVGDLLQDVCLLVQGVNLHVQGDALHAMELALALEKLNFQMLFELHKTAEKHEDSNMSDFLEDMLSEQVLRRGF